jgi:hypothetical protein
MEHRLNHILLAHPCDMVFLVVTLKKNRLTLLPVVMMLTQVFFLMLVKHMCTDLLLAMVQWLVQTKK